MSTQQQVKTPGSWDRGLDFDATRDRLKSVCQDPHLSPRKRSYASVLLIQLRNGARVSEALEAYNLFQLTGLPTQWVRCRKKKVVPGEQGELRKMLIPEIVRRTGQTMEPQSDVVECVKGFAMRDLGINSHSLRYSFITYAGRPKSEGGLGLPAPVICKITHHSKLDYILRYTQTKEGERALEGMDF